MTCILQKCPGKVLDITLFEMSFVFTIVPYKFGSTSFALLILVMLHMYSQVSHSFGLFYEERLICLVLVIKKIHE